MQYLLCFHCHSGFRNTPQCYVIRTLPVLFVFKSVQFQTERARGSDSQIRVTIEGCLTVHLPHEIAWYANLMQQGNFINVFFARHVSGTYAHHQEHSMLSCSILFSAPSFWMGGGLESRCVVHVCGADGAARTQRLSGPPPIQKLGAENHMLQLNIQCSWWWAYVPETCRAKNTLIKLPSCIKLAFQVISRDTVLRKLSALNLSVYGILIF